MKDEGCVLAYPNSSGVPTVSGVRVPSKKDVAYVRPRRFRMETLAFIIPTLRRGMWAASPDLKDAYLHIPIAPASQRFLAFEYRVRKTAPGGQFSISGH